MLIIGAGGFAMQLFDTLVELNMEDEIVFFDDTIQSPSRFIYEKFPVINSTLLATEHLKKDNRFILGTGNPGIRKMFFEKFTNLGGVPTTIISPSASIGKYKVNIGRGVTILRNTIIESNVSIGDGCLVNLNVIITHGCKIGNFCEVSPGVNILGDVLTEELCFFGAGSIILPKIILGKNCIVAAGAVVTKNFTQGFMIAGVPAIIKKTL
jgi:sugar O-acyltransferase (sialic acid O-acetyltransferase NeuD family)